MNELRLVSPNGQSIRPLVEAALVLQEKAILTGIFRTEARLRVFEAQYEMDSETFAWRFGNSELAETLDLIEWLGEIDMHELLREKLASLRAIKIQGN